VVASPVLVRNVNRSACHTGRVRSAGPSATEPQRDVGPDPAPDDDGLKEACGVFGVYAPGQHVAHLTYLGLYALQHRGQESAGIAVADGRSITVVPIYRARERGEMAGLDDLRGQVAVLHSPRAARRLSELVGSGDRSAIRIAAISRPTAEAAGEGWQEVRVASSPNDTELLALAAWLCET